MQRFQPILAALTLLSWLAVPPAASAQQPEAAASADPIEVVAFGDSLSAGYGVGPGEAFPEQLQAALQSAGYEVVVTNAGVSGDTTTGGLARLDWSVPESADLVIVELGANDALRGVSPQIARDNLDRILATLDERGQDVILAGMLAPPNMGNDYQAAFDAIYPQLAEKYGVPLYPFFLDGVAAETSLNQDDAMHPNPAGVAVIVERMLPLITESLDEIIARQGTTG
ncbi:MAG: arylesterase [Aurantimonas endophytica]|uniref:Acyl-CoA thioesterase-1 n=1 Tax=Aurantimonas endophytica TaxID=1522175 RepID=A0A7W6MQA8_9HYPH|nr:arylesterase [Aurantimonas endophytica]MBB4003752.1 acyl-CoA thioesterase-1 [Aurantimonas endophytica]MCO6404607.1 arylesterase [Aurantimonas endophytica]